MKPLAWAMFPVLLGYVLAVIVLTPIGVAIWAPPAPEPAAAQLARKLDALAAETTALKVATDRLAATPLHYCRVAVKRIDVPATHGMYDYIFELKLDRTGCELLNGKLEVVGKVLPE